MILDVMMVMMVMVINGVEGSEGVVGGWLLCGKWEVGGSRGVRGEGVGGAFWKVGGGFCGLCVCMIAGIFGVFEKLRVEKDCY